LRGAAAALIAAVLAAGLSGCARYYWSKPGGTQDLFDRDSRDCARQAAPNPTAASHGIVDAERYRGCLAARGWMREKQFEPPPSGWYRGFE
jgi:hypothetical protein